MIPKVERLLNLVALLLKRSVPVSWERDIKGRVGGYDDGSSDASLWRRFSRDKVELRSLGIEIEHVSDGPDEEGYRIDKHRYFMPPISFSHDETMLLALLAGMARDGDAALVRPLGDALAKLRYAGPLSTDMVRTASERYLFRPIARKTPTLATNLQAAGQAIWRRQTLRFRYVSPIPSPKAPAERRMDPYGLGYRSGTWYVCGKDHHRGDIRLFRLDRIKGKVLLASGRDASREFEIPDDFRLSDHFGFRPWEMGKGKPEKAVLRFDPEIAWMVEDEVDPGSFEKASDGAGRVTVQVRDPKALYAFLGRFGSRARLESSKSLRKGYRAYVGKVLQRHR